MSGPDRDILRDPDRDPDLDALLDALVEEYGVEVPTAARERSGGNGVVVPAGAGLPKGLPPELRRMLGEADAEDRSAAFFAVVTTAVELGYSDEKVVAIARHHRPGLAKYGEHVDEEALRVIEKVETRRGVRVSEAPGEDQIDPGGALPLAGDFFVDWPTFWSRDRRDADWLYEDVLARGRGHSLFAGHKVGKSLLMLAVVVKLVMRGVVVIYLDYEMGEDDLYDRLADMGYGPDTDLSRLHYALLPSLPPLDQPEGSKALLARVDQVQAQHPGADLALVIDTTGRAVAGEENSADTVRNFYRWTGLHLKQRGITWARLDHGGKDLARGQRGSSAKGDDVDVVWRLSRTEGGLELRREAARMGWVPERVAFQMQEGPLRFVRVAGAWPAGTKEVADLLDSLAVPLDVGDRPAGAALREAGHGRRQTVIRAAQKWRRQAVEEGHG